MLSAQLGDSGEKPEVSWADKQTLKKILTHTDDGKILEVSVVVIWAAKSTRNSIFHVI